MSKEEILGLCKHNINSSVIIWKKVFIIVNLLVHLPLSKNVDKLA